MKDSNGISKMIKADSGANVVRTTLINPEYNVGGEY